MSPNDNGRSSKKLSCKKIWAARRWQVCGAIVKTRGQQAAIRAEISRDDSATRFQGLGVDLFFGRAEFADKDSLTVDEQRLRFHRAMVATGAGARVPEIPGLSDAGCFTNETIFERSYAKFILIHSYITCDRKLFWRNSNSFGVFICRQNIFCPRVNCFYSNFIIQAILANGRQFFWRHKTIDNIP